MINLLVQRLLNQPEARVREVLLYQAIHFPFLKRLLNPQLLRRNEVLLQQDPQQAAH
jgi:hypothetical protein